MKHQIKLFVRAAYARLLMYTGLAHLVGRLAPQRLLILAGHCVDSSLNGELPTDMRMPPAQLEALLRAVGRHASWVTVGQGFEHLAAGTGPRSMVALSMDDGYRDNHDVLLGLLERTGARATVFLESRPLEERRVNWSHKWFWLLAREDVELLARRYIERSDDPATCEALRRVLESRPGQSADEDDIEYLAKRVLKYDAPVEDRERVIDALFAERGGDERELCDALYLTWEQAHALAAAGVELGGHTVSHEVLSRLPADEQEREISGGREVLERTLGAGQVTTFAYPFGRRWDFDDSAASAVRHAGFACAVTTHAGLNTQATDGMRLTRWMIDRDTPRHGLVAEACGGFGLLRGLGLDLSE